MSRWFGFLLVIVMIVGVACGGDDEQPQSTVPANVGATEPPTTTQPVEPTVPPTNLVTPAPGPLTPEQIQQYKPNELGQIPVLEYHQIGAVPEQFVRTPDQMRGDLQWLYDHGFYVVNLSDIVNDTLSVPAGKKPVALTFDDSPAGQFRLQKLDTGQYLIDPDCAVGIMESFFNTYPDFGRGGQFAVLPHMLFDWTTEAAEPDQQQLGQMKLQWLLDNGYELGNHTIDHVSLAGLTNDEIMYQLAEANLAIQQLVPGAPVDAITLPFGIYPDGGDDTLFRGFDYKGQHFVWQSALLVGANPTVVPISTEWDQYAVARIQAFDDELNKWFGVFEDNPGLLYVSDGDPNTLTIPTDLHPWLVGTFNETKANGRQIVRY